MLLMRSGVDPRVIGDMSLYEITTMLYAFRKTASVKEVTDEDIEEAERLLASVTVNDPNVRI